MKKRGISNWQRLRYRALCSHALPLCSHACVVSVWTWKMPVARTLQLPYYEKVRPGDCARPTQGGTRADNVHEGPKRDGAHA